MYMHDGGKVVPGNPWIITFACSSNASITVRNDLAHCSGLLTWVELGSTNQIWHSSKRKTKSYGKRTVDLKGTRTSGNLQSHLFLREALDSIREGNIRVQRELRIHIRRCRWLHPWTKQARVRPPTPGIHRRCSTKIRNTGKLTFPLHRSMLPSKQRLVCTSAISIDKQKLLCLSFGSPKQSTFSDITVLTFFWWSRVLWSKFGFPGPMVIHFESVG